MASIYSREGTAQLWLKFRHPVTGDTVRISLETGDPARAEIIRQKVEAWSVLNAPRTAHIPLQALFARRAATQPHEHGKVR